MDLISLHQILSSLWVVWFMALFIGIVAWAFWPSHRKKFEDQGHIPLRDGE